MSAPRVGHGIDVHRFRAGRPLILCGIEIEGEVGLEGVSDADVALHAVTDAILGALGRGDIGEHFPPSDPRWEGEPSGTFVARALSWARDDGYELSSCDLKIVGERPRIAPHRPRLRAALAEALGVAPDRVNVGATTVERLGAIGRGEGLAATAVVVLEDRRDR